MRIITQPDGLMARYVERFTGWHWNPAERIVTIGLLNDLDELMAAAVLCGYCRPNIFVHLAGERMTAGFIAALMHYVFVQANCTRLTGLIQAQNLAARRFAEKLGGVQEGLLLRAAPNGDNVAVYGLQIEDAQKWMGSRYIRKLEKATT